MKRILWLGFLLILIACQPQVSYITIIDGDQIYTLNTEERIPAELLTEAGISLAPADQLLPAHKYSSFSFFH